MQTDTMFDILFDKRRQEHLSEIRQLFSRYMQKPKRSKTNLFMSFSAWPNPSTHTEGTFSLEEHQALFDAKNSDLQEGGYFLSLNNKGICINPSKTFFKEFCQKGYSLHDIDVVIATKSTLCIQEAITSLHSLNRECSRTLLSYGESPHIIRFFLHPELYAAVSSQFRPLFREELNSVLSLETFTKSQEIRPLDDALTLAYTKTEGATLAIRLDLERENISFGYIAQGGYHSSLESFFAPCSILAAGIGECTAEDLEKVSMQKQTLGYYGLVQLVQDAARLKLALVCEFSRAMGDCRLELIQKLTADVDHNAKILPLDKAFMLDLDTLVLQTHAKSYSSIDDVRVLRPNGAFGQLLYLNARDVL